MYLEFLRDLERSIAIFFCWTVVIAATVGGLLVWGIPKLWEWVKPMIHSFTT